MNFQLPGCSAVPLTNTGRATCTADSLPAGLINIQVFFSGNASLDPSSGTLQQVVKAQPTVTLTALVYPVGVGDKAYLVATVASELSGANVGGGVSFFNNGSPLCANVPMDGQQRAICETPAFAAGGTFPITATYSGNSTQLPATGTLSLEVSGIAFPGVIDGPATARWGDSVTYQFSASPTGPPPTGTATYYDNYIPIPGCIELPAFTGHCTIIAQRALDLYTIRVRYSGDANYRGQMASKSLAVALRTPILSFSDQSAPLLVGETLHLRTHMEFDVLPPHIGGTISVGPCPPVPVTLASADYTCDFVPPVGTAPWTTTYTGAEFPYGNVSGSQWVSVTNVRVTVTYPCGLVRIVGQDEPVLIHVDPADATGTGDLFYDAEPLPAFYSQPLVNQESLIIASGMPVGTIYFDASYSGDATHNGSGRGFLVTVLAANDRLFAGGFDTPLPACEP